MVNDDQLRNGIGRVAVDLLVKRRPRREWSVSGSVPRAQPSRGLAGYFAMITRRQQKPELRKAVLRQGHTCVAVLLANYLLCSSGQLNSGWSGLFVLCFGIRVALRNQNRDHRKAQRVFSWLDKDGDHILRRSWRRRARCRLSPKLSYFLLSQTCRRFAARHKWTSRI